MKTTRLLHIFFTYWLLCIGFWGCTDHRVPAVTPGASRLRVKTITEDGPNGTSKVSAFRYDAQGRLSLIIGYQAPDSSTTPVENTVFQYDGQNRLTQARREVVRRAGSSPNPFEVYTFGYNADGQASGLGFSSSNFGAVTRWTASLRYTGAPHAVGSSQFFDIPGVTITNNSSFTFTGNDLTTVATTTTFVRGGTFTSTGTTTYVFDTKVNPFYGVFLIPDPANFAYPPSASLNNNTYFGGLQDVSLLSQHNIVSATNASGTTTYAHTYNAADLPTRLVTTGGNTLNLAYENW